MSAQQTIVPSSVHEERLVFETQLDDLVASGKEGKYVLFRGGEVRGFFATEDEAHEAGLDRYGLGVYLVDLVVRREAWGVPSFLNICGD